MFCQDPTYIADWKRVSARYFHPTKPLPLMNPWLLGTDFGPPPMPAMFVAVFTLLLLSRDADRLRFNPR